MAAGTRTVIRAPALIAAPSRRATTHVLVRSGASGTFLTPSTPVIHASDPLLSGKIEAHIDPPASYDQVIWFASKSSSGPFSQIDVTCPSSTLGLDGLSLCINAGAPGAVLYVEAKLHDSTGYGSVCVPIACTVSAGPPAPPPPPTAQQDLEAAIGQTVNVGDQVALYPAPSVVKTVQSDGSLA